MTTITNEFKQRFTNNLQILKHLPLNKNKNWHFFHTPIILLLEHSVMSSLIITLFPINSTCALGQEAASYHYFRIAWKSSQGVRANWHLRMIIQQFRKSNSEKIDFLPLKKSMFRTLMNNRLCSGTWLTRLLIVCVKG